MMVTSEAGRRDTTSRQGYHDCHNITRCRERPSYRLKLAARYSLRHPPIPGYSHTQLAALPPPTLATHLHDSVLKGHDD